MKILKSWFKTMYDYPNYSAIGGWASGFGNKNWKNYSKIVKPMKKVTVVSLEYLLLSPHYKCSKC